MLNRTLCRNGASIVESLEIRRLLATFGSIQAAVDSAAPGSTLTVGAGTVQEFVTINKPLTILGARSGVDARDKSRGSGETIIRGAPVTDGTRSTSFLVTASGVTIDGFTVQDDSSVNLHGAGIVIAPGVHGTRIINNIVHSNVAGLYLANNSTTDPALIQHNVFKNNNNAGEHSGHAIYSNSKVSGGNLTNVVIDGNIFTGNVGFGPPANPQAAIGLESQLRNSQSNITISNNIMQGNGKGVLLFNAKNVNITGNAMTASTDTQSAAIRIAGGSSNISIFRNAIAFNLGAAIRISRTIGGANSKITINENNLFGNSGGALIVEKHGYKEKLDALGNWWGSDTGPSRLGPGVGDAIIAPDRNVIFDPWALELIGSTPQKGNAPRTLRRILLTDLTSLRPQIPLKLRKLIDEATKNLRVSLADKLWLDDSHLAPGAMKIVLKLDEKAVEHLWELLKKFKKSSLPAGLPATLQRLGSVDRIMKMSANASDAKQTEGPKHHDDKDDDREGEDRDHEGKDD